MVENLRILFIVLLLAPLLVVSGCGGAKTAGAASSPALPAPQFTSQLTLSVASLNFGLDVEGTPSGAQYVLLSSTGTGSLTVQGVSVAGANSGDFSVSNQSGTCTAGMTLTPEATCNLRIIFNPLAAGSRNASLLITDNTANSPHEVALSGSATETLGQKLRRLEGAAAGNNPLLKPPLTLSPAWMPNTSYCHGQTVSNGGDLYLAHSAGDCNGMGSTAVSASSGGPNGSGAGPISDGSVTWYYYGPIGTASSAAPVVTNTTSAPDGLTKAYTIPSDASQFFFSGGAPYLKNPGEYCFAAVTGGSGQCSPTQMNNFASISFTTNAPRMAIGQYAGLPSRLMIDGQYLSPGGLYALVSGNPSYYVLDFSSAGGSKTRTITLENEFNSLFWGVLVDPASQVTAPDTTDHLRVIAIGDSITNGGNGFPDLTAIDWPSLAAKTLGWNDVWNSAIGGTGYIAQGTGNAFPNFGQRLQDVCSNSPDLVIVFGGINDGNSSSAQIQAAALAYFQAVRACLPATPLIVLGAWPGATGPSAGRIAIENAIQAAVNQSNDPATYFVPIATDPNGSWITGTGNVSVPAGDGNADLYISPDSVHPTNAGIAYLATHIAAAMSKVIQQIP